MQPANKSTVEEIRARFDADVAQRTAVPGVETYSVYCNSSGIFGWLGDTSALTFTNTNQAPDVAITPPLANNPFLGPGNYPGAIGFYQQRQVFGDIQADSAVVLADRFASHPDHRPASEERVERAGCVVG